MEEVDRSCDDSDSDDTALPDYTLVVWPQHGPPTYLMITTKPEKVCSLCTCFVRQSRCLSEIMFLEVDFVFVAIKATALDGIIIEVAFLILKRCRSIRVKVLLPIKLFTLKTYQSPKKFIFLTFSVQN